MKDPHRRKRIVIAATLKPVDDTRLFEKIATTLASSGRYEIHIIGFKGSGVDPPPHIFFHPWPAFRRVGFYRLLLPLIACIRMIRLRPDIVIAATHELLISAVVTRWFTRALLIYDVQENYFLNILHTTAFPPFIRQIVAGGVRINERILSPAFYSFLLAEKAFANELKFAQDRHTIIENKAIVPSGLTRSRSRDGCELLFSGTLDETTGVFSAIDLATQLNKADPTVRLHIIGHAPRATTQEALQTAMKGKTFIRLTGGGRLQPHRAIVDAIRQAHFGLICYPPSRHIADRVPTKLFEYMAHGLPILISKEFSCNGLVRDHSAGLVVDFSSGHGRAMRDEMQRLIIQSPPAHVYSWSAEAPKLLATIDGALSSKK